MERIQNFTSSPITPSYKKSYNQKLFKEVSSRYDLITKVLSLNRDPDWKQKLISYIPNQNYHLCIDIACGTGDLSFALASEFPNASIHGIDLSPEMLSLAQNKNTLPNLQFSVEDMSHLPYESNSIDLLTGGYALRNAPDLIRTLEEFLRVLKPGGIAAFLDFSKSPSKFFQSITYYLLKTWGSFWGLLLHGNPSIYNYIAESLRLYPNRNKLHKIFFDLGFEILVKKLFFFGLIEITVLQKENLKN